ASRALWGFSLVFPILRRSARTTLSTSQALVIWIVILALAALAIMSRSLIGGEDWNGFVGSTWALLFWIGMSVCVYRLRAAQVNYSALAVIAILLGSA